MTKQAIANEGPTLQKGFIEKLKQKLETNEDALFWWECACADIRNDLACIP